MKAFGSLLAWLAILIGSASIARACPNCKEALVAQPGEESRVAEGFNRSILFMMAMPFGLLGAGAFFVARAARRGTLPPL